jgi:hypothetical protein
MRRDAPGAMPLAGLALGGVVAAALAVVLLAQDRDASISDPQYLVLPRASAVGPRAAPMVAATPAAAAKPAPGQGQAGIWSTPAEFAPPD